MKLKYYLRGLGIGILVTVIIMHFAFSSRNGNLSDDEIKKKAAELGMIESTILVEPGTK